TRDRSRRSGAPRSEYSAAFRSANRAAKAFCSAGGGVVKWLCRVSFSTAPPATGWGRSLFTNAPPRAGRPHGRPSGAGGPAPRGRVPPGEEATSGADSPEDSAPIARAPRGAAESVGAAHQNFSCCLLPNDALIVQEPTCH